MRASPSGSVAAPLNQGLFAGSQIKQFDLWNAARTAPLQWLSLSPCVRAQAFKSSCSICSAITWRAHSILAGRCSVGNSPSEGR